MKKIFLMVALAFVTIFAHAQKSEVNSAYNHYVNGYLDKAKAAIDKAVLNEITKNEARTWMYCGNIYLRLAEANNDEKSNDREYMGLCSNCTEVAAEAFLKANELEQNIIVSMAIRTPLKGLEYCAHYFYETAFGLFQKKKYEEAFEMAAKAYKMNSKSDYIASFYAITAEAVQKLDIAKARYSDLIKGKTKDMNTYLRLVNIYKFENDTAKLLKVMEDGAKLFFTADTIYADFAVSYSIMLSWAGESQKAMEVMDKALEKDPTNYILLVNKGSELTNTGKYEEAEVHLKKAVELYPKDALAVYNLGNCYYNNYVKKTKALSDAPDDVYNKGMEDAKILLEQARPHLERAHELDPNDKPTITMLKTVYTYLDLKDELKALEEK